LTSRHTYASFAADETRFCPGLSTLITDAVESCTSQREWFATARKEALSASFSRSLETASTSTDAPAP